MLLYWKCTAISRARTFSMHVCEHIMEWATRHGMGDAARDLGVKCYWDPQSEIDKFMAND